MEDDAPPLKCLQILSDGTLCGFLPPIPGKTLMDPCPKCGVTDDDKSEASQVICPFLDENKFACGEEHLRDNYEKDEHCSNCGHCIPPHIWRQADPSKLNQREEEIHEGVWLCYCGQLNKPKGKPPYKPTKYCKCGKKRSDFMVCVPQMTCKLLNADGRVCGGILNFSENKDRCLVCKRNIPQEMWTSDSFDANTPWMKSESIKQPIDVEQAAPKDNFSQMEKPLREGAMEFLQSLSPEQLVETILPNLHHIEGLEKMLFNVQMLESVRYDHDKDNLYNVQHIKICNQYDLDLKTMQNEGVNCIGLIVKVIDNLMHYVMVFVCFQTKEIIFMDPLNEPLGTYRSLNNTIMNQLPQFPAAEVIKGITQERVLSLCFAYMYARALTLGYILHKSQDLSKSWLDFKKTFYSQTLMSKENVSLLPQYFISPECKFYSDSYMNVSYERQDMIKRMAKFAIKEGKDIQHVKYLLGLPEGANSQEINYLENVFLEYAIERFVEESRQYLVDHVRDIERTSILTQLNQSKDISLVGKPFCEQSIFRHVKGLYDHIPKGQKAILWNRFKTQIIECLQFETDIEYDETLLLTDLTDHLVELFMENTLSSQIISNFDFDSGGDFTTFLKEHYHDSSVFDPFRHELKNLKTLNSNFRRRIEIILREFKYGQNIEIKLSKCIADKEVLQMKAAYFDFNSHFVDIEHSMAQFQGTQNQIKEVHFVGVKCFKMNRDFTCSGLNIVIYSPFINISQPCHWDVSGAKASHFKKQATHGPQGEDGINGHNGEHGESGGNILIVYDKINGYTNLTLTTNGGLGGTGQIGGNGGDGMDGVDGYDLTKQDFEHLYPPLVTMLPKALEKRKAICLKNHVSTEEPKNEIIGSTKNFYYKLKTKTNNTVKLSFCQNSLAAAGFFIPRFRQAYCIHEGGPGEDGQPGGTGGVGGIGGEGGYAGDVTIYQGTVCPRLIATSMDFIINRNDGDRGENGNHGVGGKGGKNGDRGKDIARIEASQWARSKLLKGRLHIHMHDKEPQSMKLPYCLFNKCFIEVKMVEAPTQTIALCGKDGTDMGIVRQSKPAPRKQSIIVGEIISAYITEVHGESLLENENFLKTRQEHIKTDSLVGEQKLRQHEEFSRSRHDNTLVRFKSRRQTQRYKTKAYKHITKQTGNFADEFHKEVDQLSQDINECNILAFEPETKTKILSSDQCSNLRSHLLEIERILKQFDQYNPDYIYKVLKYIAALRTFDELTDPALMDNLEICLIRYFKICIMLKYFSNSTSEFHAVFEEIFDTMHSTDLYNYWVNGGTNNVKESNSCPNQLAAVVPKQFEETFQCMLELIPMDKDSIVNHLFLKLLSFRLNGEECCLDITSMRMIFILILSPRSLDRIENRCLKVLLETKQTEWFLSILSWCVIEDPDDVNAEDQIQSLLSNLKKVHDNEVLYLLSEKLSSLDPSDQYNSRLDFMIELLAEVDIDDEQLEELTAIELCDWWWTIQWYFCQTRLLKINIFKNDDMYIQASFFLMEIVNRHSMTVAKEIMEQINFMHGITQGSFVENLRSAINHLPLTGHDSTQERSFKTLVSMIKCDQTSSKSIRQDTVMERCTMIFNQIKKIENESIDTSDVGNCDFGLLNDDRSINRENLSILIARIKEMVHLRFNCMVLRDTQLMSIILFTESVDEGLLQQVSTGEGKSIIVAALAIIKATQGFKVNVITSSSVLAKRDAGQYKDFYDSFGISVSHNCSQIKEDRQIAYRSDIVYGEIGAFQRDHLLDTFYSQNILGDRTTESPQLCVIVDEVDCMILDKGETMLYLSHDIAGIEALEPVYIWIWNIVNSITGNDINLVEQIANSVIFGCLTTEYLEHRFKEFGQPISRVRMYDIWTRLNKERIISDNGYIHQDIEKLTIDILDTWEMDARDKNVTLCVLKDVKRMKNVCDTPAYLTPFVKLHIKDWIESAFKAKCMVEGDHYILDIDRTESNQGKNVNIVIIDKDTGAEQYNSQWSHGLHQFLQLKHGCRLQYESLKAVFISNITYFKMYDNRLYGLTGTLGSQSERMTLRSLYKTQYVNIPTFRQVRFMEKHAIVCLSEPEWILETVNQAIIVAKKQPVLVICETIANLGKIRQQLAKANEKSKLFKFHVYKNSYQSLDFLPEMGSLNKPDIILATNIAGRGTDIKISDTLETNGGLHVIMTYLPRNSRVEQQAFGRAARKGQRGSGQLIILQENIEPLDSPSSIFQLRLQRDKEEMTNIRDLASFYKKHLKAEEDLFQMFTKDIYKIAKQKFRNGKLLKGVEEILLQSILDEWAFWLDKPENKITDCPSDKLYMMKKEIIDLQTTEATDWEKTIKNPTMQIKLAKLYIKEGIFERAITILDKVISLQSNSPAAYYYRGFCKLSRGQPKLTGQQSIKSTAESDFVVCHQLLAEKVELFSQFSATVGKISEIYTMSQRVNSIIINDYQTQKETFIEIFLHIKYSIDEILGRPVNLQYLHEKSDNLYFAGHLLRVMRIHKIISPPRFRGGALKKLKDKASRVDMETYETMHECFQDERAKVYLKVKYEQYWSEINDKLKYLLTTRKDSDGLFPIDFSGLLPSREEFWDFLLKQNYLSGIHTYLILDTERLGNKHNLEKFGEWISNLIPVEKSKYLEMGKVMNFYICSRGCPSIQSIISNIKYKVIQTKEWSKDKIPCSTLLLCLFLQEGLIWNLQTCSIKEVDNSQLQSCTFKKFDSINVNDFDRLKSVDNQGTLIIQKLVELDILMLQNDIAESLTLNVEKADLAKLPLIPECEHLQSEIESVLRKCFAYKLALLDFMNGNELSLEQYPHENLYFDLIRYGIIQDYTLSNEKAKGKLEALLSCVGNPHDKGLAKAEVKHLMAMECCFDHETSVWDATEQMDFVLKHMNPSNSTGQFFEEFHPSRIPELFQGEELKLSDKRNMLRTIITDIDSQCHPVQKEFILSRCQTASYVKTQLDNILKCRDMYNKYEQPYATLNSIEECFDLDEQFEHNYELSIMNESGFGDIISLREKRWHWKAVCKISVIICLGVAQILLGALLTFPSIGIGAGLIFEGANDLMFAMKGIISGHFSWKEFGKHKILSLLFTALILGPLNLIARSATGTGFGVGIAKSFTAATKASAASAVIKRVVPRLAGVAVLLAAPRLANFAINSSLADKYNSSTRDTITKFKSDWNGRGYEKLIDNMIVKVGLKNTSDVLNKITLTKHKPSLDKISVGRLPRKVLRKPRQSALSDLKRGIGDKPITFISDEVRPTTDFIRENIEFATARFEMSSVFEQIYGQANGCAINLLHELRRELDALDKETKNKNSEGEQEISSAEVNNVCSQWQSDLIEILKSTLDEYYVSLDHDIQTLLAKEVGDGLRRDVDRLTSAKENRMFIHMKTQQLEYEREMKSNPLPQIERPSIPMDTHQRVWGIFNKTLLKIAKLQKNEQLIRELINKFDLTLREEDAQIVANLTGTNFHILKLSSGGYERIFFQPENSRLKPGSLEIVARGTNTYIKMPGGIQYRCLYKAVSSSSN